jgi:NAD+ synthase (glutamine-hydrolysing)
MRDGFVKVVACSPKIRVADVQGNVEACVAAVGSAVHAGAKVIVLPELCVCGSTCGDLLWQRTLMEAVEDGVNLIAAQTAQYDAVIVVGAPVAVRQKLYNCAVVISQAKILGVVPKINLSAAELRYFQSGKGTQGTIHYAGSSEVPFGPKQIFLSPKPSTESALSKRAITSASASAKSLPIPGT